MATSLQAEFSKFCKLSKQLRQILRDTQKCYQDINSGGNFENGPLWNAELSKTEEDEIAAIVKKPPCMVVLGQTPYAKAFIVNEIFGKTILPTVDYGKELVRWRSVRFKYGEKTNISLTLPGSFELVDNLAAYNQIWQTIPKEDLEVSTTDKDDLAKGSAILEVKLCHPLLKDGGRVIVSPCNTCDNMEQIYMNCTSNVVPVFVYAITEDCFSEKEMKELRELKEISPSIAVFFVKVPLPLKKEKTFKHRSKSPIRTLQDTLEKHTLQVNKTSQALNFFQQLLQLKYLSLIPAQSGSSHFENSTEVNHFESELVEDFDNFANLSAFTKHILMNDLVKTTSLLNLIHTRCLQMFIMTAFDMARDMMITPKRLIFAREKETELYNSLMDIALKKQDEIKRIIGATILDMREELLEKAAEYDFIGVEILESGEITSPRELRICTGQIQELVLGGLNSAIAGKLLGSVDVLKDSYTGVLTRCLESLEQYDKSSQENVQITLALQEILNSAYQVEITVRAGSSLVQVLLEKMKQLIQAMPWSTPPKISPEWKCKVAAEMLNSLSESRLAKSICAQIKDRLKNSHDTFNIALKQLETKHTGRLEKTEEQRLKVRKVHAPKVARLALESTSHKDYILYGMPEMGREVGRGQYGVVYSCDKWAGYGPCAIKSVVPPDDKHWNDLALEFYYTKNVPEHDRIMALRGSIIDYSYAGGSSPAVLLVMDRLQKDLYAAIKQGLDWISRLQVAIDVVEGIRFLHNQGLVHRDIKLKNVLLDKENRGKITDLGFCKPEAMMSGSVVGTPVHMAPELFTGKYDNSVDVYAFGILFWYVCAGHVRLPYAFEQCHSKDMLWTSVRKGVRPERLPQFDEECWIMMQNCWNGDPFQRPLLGIIHPQLERIYHHYKKQSAHKKASSTATVSH